MADSDNTAALLSSGLVHKYLLPQLRISDLLNLENISTSFRQLVGSAAEEVWTAAIARSLPHSHHLARVQTGCEQAARQYVRHQMAIATQSFLSA